MIWLWWLGVAAVILVPLWGVILYQWRQTRRRARRQQVKARISAALGIPEDKMVVASTGPMLYDGEELWRLTSFELTYLQHHNITDEKEQGEWVRAHRAGEA